MRNKPYSFSFFSYKSELGLTFIVSECSVWRKWTVHKRFRIAWLEHYLERYLEAPGPRPACNLAGSPPAGERQGRVTVPTKTRQTPL